MQMRCIARTSFKVESKFIDLTDKLRCIPSCCYIFHSLRAALRVPFCNFNIHNVTCTLGKLAFSYRHGSKWICKSLETFGKFEISGLVSGTSLWNLITRFWLTEFNVILYRSIALWMLYQISFDSKFIGWSVWLIIN